MPYFIKTLSLNVIYLGLILSLHFGLLTLAFGYYWMRFLNANFLEIALSVLILTIAYISAFLFFRSPKKKLYSFCLYAISIISAAYLIYAVFFSDGTFRKIITSTVLFIGVSILLNFCHAQKAKKIWGYLRYILLTALVLFSLVTINYIYQGFVATMTPSPLTASLEPQKLKKEHSSIKTDFYQIYTTQYYITDYYIPARVSNIPSYISAIDDKNFLVVDRHGKIYHLRLQKENAEPSEEDLYARRLPTTFPINYKELLSSDEGKKVKMSYFRVHDIYIEEENKKVNERSLYVSHHHWNIQQKCFTLRLTKLVGDISTLLNLSSSPKWKTIYETTPCFPIKSKGNPFMGNQAGGRIIGFGEENLLFSVGDHGFDTEHYGTENFPQDTNVSYGKIWKINRHSGESRLFSIGHRNPQGLYRSPDGTIWETEHGPASGDELNNIKLGGNYGWPHVLFGTSYETSIWPPGIYQDSHGDYDHPTFAWVPAIAVSNLIGVEGDLFPSWKNDLLIGSLKSKTLFRLQMYKDRVIYSEPIKINYRIRDLIQTPNGEIFIWTNGQHLIRLRSKNPTPNKNQPIEKIGEQLFNQKCIGCHNIRPRVPHGIGPNLHRVYKSRIASQNDYSYSPSLQTKSQSRWTRENLDLFLKDPQAFAPGTAMQIGIPDNGDRKALLRYLENH